MCIGIFNWFLLLDIPISWNPRATAKRGRFQPACIKYAPVIDYKYNFFPGFLLVPFRVCHLPVPGAVPGHPIPSLPGAHPSDCLGANDWPGQATWFWSCGVCLLVWFFFALPDFFPEDWCVSVAALQWAWVKRQDLASGGEGLGLLWALSF